MNRATSDKRLLMLAERLKTVPPAQFNMGTFVDTLTWKGDPGLGCGTAACAAGWATTIPAFRRAGFHLKRGWSSVFYKNEMGFEACVLFFGITSLEAEEIFYGRFYGGTTPKQKAKQIIEFVKKRAKERQTA